MVWQVDNDLIEYCNKIKSTSKRVS